MGTNCISCVCSKTGPQSVIESDYEELCCRLATESSNSTEIDTTIPESARSSIKVKKKKSPFDVKKRKHQSVTATNYKTGIPLTEFLSQKDDF